MVKDVKTNHINMKNKSALSVLVSILSLALLAVCGLVMLGGEFFSWIGKGLHYVYHFIVIRPFDYKSCIVYIILLLTIVALVYWIWNAFKSESVQVHQLVAPFTTLMMPFIVLAAIRGKTLGVWDSDEKALTIIALVALIIYVLSSLSTLIFTFVLTKKTRKRLKINGVLFKRLFIYFMLFLMYLPVLVLVVFSFTTSTNVGQWTGFSFGLYIDLFRNKALMSAVWNTFLIAVASAVVSTILGTLGAIGTFYSRKKTRKVIETMNQLPVINAEIVIALSLAIMVIAVGVTFSFFTLLIGHVVLTIAFVYLNVKPKLTQMDPFAYEAALDLGAKPRYALYKIVLPEILPGILSGFMISFTLSLDDFVITQYLKEPSFETISTYIQKIIAKHPIPPEVRALTTIIFVVVLVVVVGNTIYNNRRAKAVVSHRKKGGF